MTSSRITGVQGTPANIPTGVPHSSSGGIALRACPFAYNTPGLATPLPPHGAALYTPTPGDWLLDLWIAIDTPWNGTTPLGDVGQFLHEVVNEPGWYNVLGEGGTVDMTKQDRTDDILTEGATISSGFTLSMAALNAIYNTFFGSVVVSGSDLTFPNSGPASGNLNNGGRYFPAKFTTADPIKVVVTQDGLGGSADPGATQGAATLYLVTATPS